MKVYGINGMNILQVQDELAGGGKFVRFSFCISVVVASFRYSSAVYLIRNGETTFRKSLPYTLISCVLGWWGIPWGPVNTVSSLLTNIGGGRDVTGEMLRILHRHTQGHVFDFEQTKAPLASN